MLHRMSPVVADFVAELGDDGGAVARTKLLMRFAMYCTGSGK